MINSNKMDKRTSAKLAQGTYKFAQKGKSRDKRIGEVNDFIKATGYEIDASNSNRNGVVTYRQRDNPDKIHIAHMGTNTARRGGYKDIGSDLAIAFGFGGHDRQAKQRKNKTEKIVKKLNPEELTLSAHSLGAFTLNYTIAKSKTVRDKLDKADTFNGASNSVFNNDLDVSKKVKRDLKDKVVHHRIKHDVVSKGFKAGVPFGTLKTYKLRAEPSEVEDRRADSIVKTKEELEGMNFTGKALNAHHISHFADRDLDEVTK